MIVSNVNSKKRLFSRILGNLEGDRLILSDSPSLEESELELEVTEVAVVFFSTAALISREKTDRTLVQRG